jgi:hypothetical protein
VDRTKLIQKQVSTIKVSSDVMFISKEMWPILWLPAFCPFTYTAAVHCKQDPIYVFPEIKLHCLVPNLKIHISVSDLYIHQFAAAK